MQVRELQSPEVVFEKILGLIVRLAEHGLIHCDFNEFNIMVTPSYFIILARVAREYTTTQEDDMTHTRTC